MARFRNRRKRGGDPTAAEIERRIAAVPAEDWDAFKRGVAELEQAFDDPDGKGEEPPSRDYLLALSYINPPRHRELIAEFKQQAQTLITTAVAEVTDDPELHRRLVRACLRSVDSLPEWNVPALKVCAEKMGEFIHQMATEGTLADFCDTAEAMTDAEMAQTAEGMF